MNHLGCRARVIEDCLNGSRTVWDDPVKPERRGIEGLARRIEVNSPLDLVILFPGTNDFQCIHRNEPQDSANRIAELIAEIRSAPLEPTMKCPEILVVAPPVLQEAKGEIAEKFAGSEKRSAGLNSAIQAIAEQHDSYFFDAASVARTSRLDGVHLDLNQHAALAKALVPVVDGILDSLADH